jgi:hypothetical protein
MKNHFGKSLRENRIEECATYNQNLVSFLRFDRDQKTAKDIHAVIRSILFSKSPNHHWRGATPSVEVC